MENPISFRQSYHYSTQIQDQSQSYPSFRSFIRGEKDLWGNKAGLYPAFAPDLVCLYLGREKNFNAQLGNFV